MCILPQLKFFKIKAINTEANEHMKRCSILNVIREMQTETIVKYYYTLVEWLKFKTSITPNAGKDAEQ